MIMASYTDLLPQLTANIGDRVFKRWDYSSDGIGNTIQDFYRARPDLFSGIQLTPERRFNETNAENGSGYNTWDFGAANDILQNYEVQRRGEAGMKDGRRDVIVDKRTGQIVYAGNNPYTYDPAKTNLTDAVRFAALAAGGYFGVNALAGLDGATGLGATGAFDSAGWAGTGIDGATGVSGAAGGGLGATGAFDSAGWAGTGIDGATGMSGGAGLLNGIGKAAGTVWDFAKANPKLAGALVGGLLGGSGGSSGDGYKYTGPMPTITQGGWKPSVQPNLMQTQSVVQGLPQVQGNQYSGLLRFMGG